MAGRRIGSLYGVEGVLVTVDESPTLRRRRLGAELKKCRERAHMTQEAVSRHFEWNTAKVTRIETARVAVSARDVRDMLTLYGEHGEEYREALVDLARLSKERSWWTDYKDVMRPGNFVGLEAGASAMRVFEPTVLPGLLQTEGYMRALLRTGMPSEVPEHIDRRISLRLTRQKRLTGSNPLELAALVDESVLRRTIGGDDVMADQLRHLIEATQSPNVTFQILPLNAGEHLFLSGPAALLEFRETTHLDVVYLEGLAGDYYEEQPSEVARYREEFDRLSARALDHRMSLKMIESLLQL